MFTVALKNAANRAKVFAGRRFSIFNEKPTYKISNNIPTIGATIGTIAFCFQVFVLYPWHKELSDQFDALQNVVLSLERTASTLDEKMNTVLTLENEVKLKEKRILEKEEEILNAEITLASKLDLLLDKQHISYKAHN